MLAVVAIILYSFGQRLDRSRVYRIGWEVDPPFQLSGVDGQPTGPAIELVKEAARRGGIRLEWIRRPRFSIESLERGGDLDLWVLLTVRPERTTRVHITDPYLITELCFLVRADSKFHQVADLTGATISTDNIPLNLEYIRALVPNATAIPREAEIAPVEDVCARRADAAFLEGNSAVSALLGGISCGGTPLRWISVPGKRTRLGIGSSFEVSRVADAIRSEIGDMAEQGTARTPLGRWGNLSGTQLEHIQESLNASRRERWLITGIAVSIALVVLAVWQALRIRAEVRRSRQAEAARLISEQQLRLLADSLNDMVLAYDMNRRLIYANPAVTSLTGYSVEELSRRAFINWFHPADQEKMMSLWSSVFHGGSFHDEVYQLITRDGRIKWASATWGPLLDKSGQQVGVQGSERDVTAQKEAEDALRASEWRFRHLLENVGLPAAILDLEGRIVFGNATLADIVEWSRDDLRGQPIAKLFPDSDHDELRNALARIAEGTQPDTCDRQFVLLTRSGGRRQVQVSVVVLRNHDGSVMAVAAVGVDLTSHNTLQEQYFQAQKMESVGRLAGGIAHDFNNLLTLINGYSDLLLQSQPASEALLEIRSAGERAAALTRQLLSFSRKQASARTRIDLNVLVAEAASMLRRLLGTDIEMVCDLRADPSCITADPGQLQQVLMNLAVNARDAMPGGGKLTIATRFTQSLPRDWEPTHGMDRGMGPCVILTVTDTGHGMSEEVRSHVFEPFFTTKPAGKGTGLGLSIVYNIVQQAGGLLYLESEPGKGTRFSICLPVSTEAGTQTQAQSGPGSLSGTETILLVEDQPGVRIFTAAVLTGYGYRVLEAGDPQQALQIVTSCREHIHLLLSDVVMPQMSGRELARKIAALKPGIRVLLMSGYDSESGTTDLVTPLLQKPFSPAALGAKVREILSAGGGN